jgi:dolichol-phosphate mannosyltransferase
MVNKKKIDISVVVPVYGCDDSLFELCNRLSVTLSEIVEKFEILLVDDCGPGNPWSIIQELSEKNSSVFGIKLSKNFGQHVAIIAGLTQSTGDWVVVIDGDLQDRPEEITKLYEEAKSGVDIVFARRIDRQDSILKKLFSRLFYKVLGYMTDTKLDPSTANFGIFNRKVIDAVLSMTEVHKFFPVMVNWVGFSSTSISVKHEKRTNGETSYNFSKLFGLAVGIIMSFSDKPLRLIIKFGFGVSLISALNALLIIYTYFFKEDIKVSGWASTMVSMWFIGGLLMIIIGVVGLYVGKTFDQTKSRPEYILDKMTKY